MGRCTSQKELYKMVSATAPQPASASSLRELRDGIDLAERLIVRLDRTNIQQFLVLMDQIEHMWSEHSDPSSLHAEHGRWQGLLKRIATSPKLVNDAAAQAGGLTKMRSQFPPATGAWWHADQQIAGQRNQTLQRVAMAVGVVVLAIVAYWVINYFMSRNTVAATAVDSSPEIEQLVEQQRWQDARAVVETARKSYPDDAALLVWDSVLAAQLGEREQAQASLARAQTTFVGKPAAFWVLVANSRLQTVDWDGADEAARQALALTPQDGEVTFLLGRIAEARGDLAQANEFFNQTLALAGDSNPELVALVKIRMGYLMQGAGPLPSSATLPESTATTRP